MGFDDGVVEDELYDIFFGQVVGGSGVLVDFYFVSGLVDYVFVYCFFE